MTPSIGLVLVGAGSSQRMGPIDKIWEPLGNRPVVWYSLSRFNKVARECVLVVRQDQMERARALCSELAPVTVVAGGEDRQTSVARGLAALGRVDIVAIHDVARPFASLDLLQIGVDTLQDYDGVVPVVPIADTIREIDGSRVVSALERRRLRAVQTPQIFRSGPVRDAHERTRRDRRTGTDDAQLLEWCGFRIGTFPGEPANFKITTPHDLLLARLLVETSRSPE